MRYQRLNRYDNPNPNPNTMKHEMLGLIIEGQGPFEVYAQDGEDTELLFTFSAKAIIDRRRETVEVDVRWIDGPGIMPRHRFGLLPLAELLARELLEYGELVDYEEDGPCPDEAMERGLYA